MEHRIAYDPHMDLPITPGMEVEVETETGIQPRRVVEVTGDTVYVCGEEEFKRATVDRRQPVLCGFRKRWVVRVLQDR
jgi:hypothetical protein